MNLDRALVVLGVFAAALGGYLTHLHSLYPAFTELNPFSAYHVAGAWYPAVKVLGAFALYPLTKWCLEAWDRSEHQSRVWIALTAVLVVDLIGNLWVGGFSWVNSAAFELRSAWIAGFAVLSVLVVLYRDRILRHRRTAAAGLLLAGVLLIGVPAVDAQQITVEKNVTDGGAWGMEVVNNTIYVSHDDAGSLTVYDEDLNQLNTVATGEVIETRAMYFDGSTNLYVAGANASGNLALAKIDVSTPTNPSLIDSNGTAYDDLDTNHLGRGLTFDGSVAIVASENRVHRIDNEGLGEIVETLNLAGHYHEISQDEDRLYVSDSTNNHFNVLHKSNLTEINQVNEVFTGQAISLINGFLYTDRIAIYTDGDDPTKVSSINLPGDDPGGIDIVKYEDWIFTSTISSNKNITRVDISDKSNPRVSGFNDTVGGWDLTIHNDSLYATDRTPATATVLKLNIFQGDHAPELTNGRPTGGTNVKPQPTLSVDVNDTDFASVASEQVNVSFYDFDSGNFIDNTTLTSNGTASVTWSSADHSSTHRWLAIATDIDGRQDTSDVHSFNINNEAPTLTDPTPRNDALRVTTSSVTLNVNVTDPNLPNNDTVNVSWWNASNDNRLDSVDATSNGTVSGTWSSVGRGYHTYYVNATDNASNTFTTTNLRFKTPGQLSFFDASNGDPVTETLSVRVTGPNNQETITVTDGTFEWEDYSTLADEEYSVRVTSSSYATTTFTIQDVALSHNIYLSPTSQDITFDLNDNSGNFPGGDTQLTVAEDITSDGDATNITAQNYFGSDNTVTFSLQQGETYELYVENTATGDGRHVGTYTVPASSDTQTITIGQLAGADWQIDDASADPTGETIVDGDGTESLSIDITDMDTNDIINVSFYNASNDDRIASQEVTGSGTNTASVTWSVPSGTTRAWYVIATDENNVQRASNTHTFGTSGSIVFRNSTTGNLVTDTITLNITRADGQTFDESINSGYWNWTNLTQIPQNEVFLDINSTDYFGTTLQLTSVAQNNTVFLINSTSFTGNRLDVTFVLNDLTGNYPAENTTLEIRRSVSGNYTTVKSGTFGAANALGTDIESGTHYRLRIENNEGDIRELGAFQVTQAGTYTLDVGRVDWNFTDSGGYTWDAFMSENSAGQDILRFKFNDTANDTELLDVKIYEQDNESANTIYDQIDQGPFGEKVVTQQLSSEQADRTWVVEWQATRNGETINGTAVLGDSPFDVPTKLDPKYLLFLVGGLILFTAGLFGDENSAVGGVVVVGVAGMLWYLGWFDIGVGVLVLAGILAVANKVAQPGEA